MAFCLMVVFGYKQPKSLRKRIKLYTKLGGKFVGYLKVPDKSLSLVEQCWDLQKQAAKLWPSDKSYLDVLLYVGNTLITKSNIKLLDIIQNGTPLQMMWDACYTRSMELDYNYFPTLFYRS
jgi:hypothetical protein